MEVQGWWRGKRSAWGPPGNAGDRPAGAAPAEAAPLLEAGPGAADIVADAASGSASVKLLTLMLLFAPAP